MREAVLGPPLVFAQHRRSSAADRLSTRPSTALAADRRHQPGLRASHHRLRTVPVRSAGVQRLYPFPAGARELGVLTVTPAKPIPLRGSTSAACRPHQKVLGWRLAGAAPAHAQASRKLRKPGLPGSRRARSRRDPSGSALPPVGPDEFSALMNLRSFAIAEVGSRLIRLTKRQTIFGCRFFRDRTAPSIAPPAAPARPFQLEPLVIGERQGRHHADDGHDP
jgi:hypothetical protein